MTVAVRVHQRPDGEWRHVCYRTADGIHRQNIGCSHLIPRDAIRHADRLAEPLRSPAEGSPAASVPLAGVASAEPSAGAPRGTPRLVRGRR